MCFLVPPAVSYKETFLRGAADFHAHGQLDSTYAVCLGYNLKSLNRRFARFVQDLLDLQTPTSPYSTQYRDRVLWLIDGDEYIGQSSVRPDLSSNYLITYGGHIGYSIRPSKRRRGYGKKILAATLEQARLMDLKRILITCNSDNTGSRKIIESNGGRFERDLPMDADCFRAEGRPLQAGLTKLRYWIDLSLDPAPPRP
ncbi:MAG: GNAT family N-acetyltransferase [Candidatus Latescibacteria bacterium]|nr:GNAT family N-acetyltransferase [Candidatus Latescibacterota bacterium]